MALYGRWLLYASFLTDANLYHVLDHIDDDLAATAHAAGCPCCDGRLHRADYPRKPRAGPAVLGSGYDRRRSFCCSRQGCRDRVTPPSVRFLGRKVFLGAVVVLLSALRHGATAVRLGKLRKYIGVSRRTLDRWRLWWQEAFAHSAFWRQAMGRFAPPPPEMATLPASVLARFAGDESGRLVAALRFLSPITTGSAPSGMAF